MDINELAKRVQALEDIEAIKKASDELTNKAQEVGAALYKDQQQGQAPEQPAEQNQTPESDQTVDGQYEEKQDDSKEESK